MPDHSQQQSPDRQVEDMFSPLAMTQFVREHVAQERRSWDFYIGPNSEHLAEHEQGQLWSWLRLHGFNVRELHWLDDVTVADDQLMVLCSVPGQPQALVTVRVLVRPPDCMKRYVVTAEGARACPST